jgi:hypothetical protein
MQKHKTRMRDKGCEYIQDVIEASLVKGAFNKQDLNDVKEQVVPIWSEVLGSKCKDPEACEFFYLVGRIAWGTLYLK